MENQSITNRSRGLDLDNDLKFHSTEQSFRGEIILRGLDNRTYRLLDYVHGRPQGILSVELQGLAVPQE